MRDQLLQFVETERRAEFNEILLSHELPIEERVAHGVCLPGLRLVRRDSRSYVFRFDENYSKFRPGDWLVLGRGEPTGADVRAGTRVILEEYDPVQKQVSLRIRQGRIAEPETTFTLDFEHADYTSHRLIRAVEIAFTEHPTIQRLLNGKYKPRVSDPPPHAQEALSEVCKKTPLDPSQIQAFLGIFCKPVSLIQGPPGSGKTELLAHIVASMAAMGKNVLVTAFTHQAINNVLNAIVKKTGFRNIVKVDTRRTDEDLDSSIARVEDSNSSYSRENQSAVYGATVYRAYKMAEGGGVPFHVVAFDEAGQLTIPHALAAMINSERYVFVGDHKQLPPLIKARHLDPTISRSIFEHLTELYPEHSTMLEVTYRMNRGINEFPSQEFYDGRLEPSIQAAENTFVPSKGGKLIDVISRPEAVTFVQVNHQDAQQLASQEAQVVALLAHDLLTIHRVSPRELGIIAPHRAQVREIRDRLSHLLARKKDIRLAIGIDLIIDTVERMQGQERDVMILSLTLSDDDFARSEADFIFKPNRLNVAITRARTRLFVVGSKHFFRTKIYNEDQLQDANVYKRYYRYLREHSVDLTEFMSTQSNGG